MVEIRLAAFVVVLVIVLVVLVLVLVPIKFGPGSNIGHGLFVGWVESARRIGFLRQRTHLGASHFYCCQRNPTKWPKIDPFPSRAAPLAASVQSDRKRNFEKANTRLPCIVHWVGVIIDL